MAETTYEYHIPADAPEGTEIEPSKVTRTIDLTPAGMTTPEGCAKVTKARTEWEDSQASLANAASQFIDEHRDDIRHCMAMYGGVMEDWHQLEALAGAMQRKQDAFLRAVSGR